MTTRAQLLEVLQVLRNELGHTHRHTPPQPPSTISPQAAAAQPQPSLLNSDAHGGDQEAEHGGELNAPHNPAYGPSTTQPSNDTSAPKRFSVLEAAAAGVDWAVVDLFFSQIRATPLPAGWDLGKLPDGSIFFVKYAVIHCSLSSIAFQRLA